MPTRARLDEFIATVVSGDHAGAIERYYTDDASMQENAAPPRVGRDVLVAQERATLERVKTVVSTCVSSILEGDRVAINWIFDFTYLSGKTARIDEVALQEWRGDIHHAEIGRDRILRGRLAAGRFDQQLVERLQELGSEDLDHG